MTCLKLIQFDFSESFCFHIFQFLVNNNSAEEHSIMKKEIKWKYNSLTKDVDGCIYVSVSRINNLIENTVARKGRSDAKSIGVETNNELLVRKLTFYFCFLKC